MKLRLRLIVRFALPVIPLQLGGSGRPWCPPPLRQPRRAKLGDRAWEPAL